MYIFIFVVSNVPRRKILIQNRTICTRIIIITNFIYPNRPRPLYRKYRERRRGNKLNIAMCIVDMIEVEGGISHNEPMHLVHIRHNSDVTVGTMASQITSTSPICWTFCLGSHQRKHQRSASLVFVRGIHRWPVDPPHKGPVTRKMIPFDDVIMVSLLAHGYPNFVYKKGGMILILR